MFGLFTGIVSKVLGGAALVALLIAGVQTWRLSSSEKANQTLLKEVGSLTANLDQAINLANANADATREVERLLKITEEVLVADRLAAIAVGHRHVKIREVVNVVVRENPATCPVAPGVRAALVELYGQPTP